MKPEFLHAVLNDRQQLQEFFKSSGFKKLMYVSENMIELPNYLKLCHAYRQAASIFICVSSSVTPVTANLSQSYVTLLTLQSKGCLSVCISTNPVNVVNVSPEDMSSFFSELKMTLLQMHQLQKLLQSGYFTSRSASFKPLVMRYFRTGWFKNSYEGYRSYSEQIRLDR